MAVAVDVTARVLLRYFEVHLRTTLIKPPAVAHCWGVAEVPVLVPWVEAQQAPTAITRHDVSDLDTVRVDHQDRSHVGDEGSAVNVACLAKELFDVDSDGERDLNHLRRGGLEARRLNVVVIVMVCRAVTMRAGIQGPAATRV